MTETSSAPPRPGGDPLLRMRAYRVACELIDDAWKDVEKLKHDKATEKISGQLYASVGSIAQTWQKVMPIARAAIVPGSSNTRSGQPGKAGCGTRQQNRFWEDQRFSNGSQSL